MRNKMITLCPTTYETAKAMPNFSAWVRNKLRDLEDYRPESTVTYRYKCPICTNKESSTKRVARMCVKCDYQMKYVGVVE